MLGEVNKGSNGTSGSKVSSLACLTHHKYLHHYMLQRSGSLKDKLVQAKICEVICLPKKSFVSYPLFPRCLRLSNLAENVCFLGIISG